SWESDATAPGWMRALRSRVQKTPYALFLLRTWPATKTMQPSSTRSSGSTCITMEQRALDAPMPDIQPGDREQGAVVESLLLVAGRPLQRAELRKILGIDDTRLTAALH